MRVTAKRLGLHSAAALMLFAAGCRDNPAAPAQTGTIQVSVQTTGGDPDSDGYVIVTSNSRNPITAQGATTITGIKVGVNTLTLEGVSPNCTVDGPQPLPVTVGAGQTLPVTLVVECETTGIALVTHTTGDDNPFGYKVLVVTPSFFESVHALAANDSAVVSRLPPGNYAVQLTTSTACTTANNGARSVSVSNRAVTLIAFDVTCVPPQRAEKIAYVVDMITNGASESDIALINPDGSGTRNLAIGTSPTWASDGRRLIYSNTQCDYYDYYCTGNLVLTDPETGAVLGLNDNNLATNPAWAPTGDLLAFVSDSRLYVMKLDGWPAVRLSVPGVVFADDPAWSPDGQQIVFSCKFVATDIADLCVTKRDGSEVSMLTTAGAGDAGPAWSPDGSRIAFTRSSGPRQIMLIAANGGSPSVLTDGFDPAWSPDGSKLVFARDDGLFTINADGSSPTRLTTGPHHAPAWRP